MNEYWFIGGLVAFLIGMKVIKDWQGSDPVTRAQWAKEWEEQRRTEPRRAQYDCDGNLM